MHSVVTLLMHRIRKKHWLAGVLVDVNLVQLLLELVPVHFIGNQPMRYYPWICCQLEIIVLGYFDPTKQLYIKTKIFEPTQSFYQLNKNTGHNLYTLSTLRSLQTVLLFCPIYCALWTYDVQVNIQLFRRKDTCLVPFEIHFRANIGLASIHSPILLFLYVRKVTGI